MYSGETAGDTSASFTRRSVGVVLKFPLGSVQTPHLTVVADAQLMDTNDALRCIYHPLLSLPVLGCEQTMLVCDVSSQNTFFFFNLCLIKVCKKLAWEVS